MIGVLEYQKSDGKLIGHTIYTSEDDIPDDTLEIGYIISDKSTALNKVDVITGEIIERADNNAALDFDTINADGVDEATITNVPNPSTAIINGEKYSEEITDGKLVFTTDVEGTYFIQILSFPFKDKEFIVNAS